MRTIVLGVLVVLVGGLLLLYVNSRPQIDRGLRVSVASGDSETTRSTPPAATAAAAAPLAAPGEAAPSPVIDPRPRVVAPVDLTRAGTATPRAAPEPRAAPQRPATTSPPAAPAPVADLPAPSARRTLPVSQPPLPRAGGNDATRAADTAATDPRAAPCRALSAYLADLDRREARGVQGGEAAMLNEQRSITRARQAELRCPI
jgi:hypothetical protein